MFKLFLVLVRVGGVVIFGGAYLYNVGVIDTIHGNLLFKKKKSRWGTWGGGIIGENTDVCIWWESGNTCCASNFDDCCDSDDGAVAGLVEASRGRSGSG